MRIGQGFDVHAFESGDHVVIGGVTIPHTQGLKAHSDGDVLLHALADALLGAAALGADSRILLRTVMARVAEQGLRVVNVDSTVIAQSPRMAPHIATMRHNIAEDLGVDLHSVSVKATTTERLGFTGRGEGIAAQAICLLAPVNS